jgi:hypothetical protein
VQKLDRTDDSGKEHKQEPKVDAGSGKKKVAVPPDPDARHPIG